MAHPFVAARRQVAVQGKNVSQRVRPSTKSGYRYGLGASTSPLARRRINLKHAETTRFATCKRPTNRLPRPKSEKRAAGRRQHGNQTQTSVGLFRVNQPHLFDLICLMVDEFHLGTQSHQRRRDHSVGRNNIGAAITPVRSRLLRAARDATNRRAPHRPRGTSARALYDESYAFAECLPLETKGFNATSSR